MFIAGITNGKEGVVTMLENHMHGLEDGDRVTMREVEGMHEINGVVQRITVVNPFTFKIGDTEGYGQYLRGGIAAQLHRRT